MLLSVENLDVSYGAIRALRGISLTIKTGQIVTLIGANGAGKTTLLRTLSGLLKPAHGRILWHGSGKGIDTRRIKCEPYPVLQHHAGSASVATPADSSAASSSASAQSSSDPKSSSQPTANTEMNASGGAASGVATKSQASTESLPETTTVMLPAIHRLPPHEIVRLGISHVPEGRQIFPQLTVRENLLLGAYQRTLKPAIQEDLAQSMELFPILAQRISQRAGTLSGGEQQMLAIARALMARPRLLLLDEPSLGLAPLIVRKIFDIIKRINAEGTTIFLVEQNAHMALAIAHQAYVMQSGQILMADSAKNLLANPEVQKAYLGA